MRGARIFLRAALPEIVTPHAHDALYAGVRPLSLLQPPLGEMDDLEKIDGIDPATAERLNALGIWTYTQIACWSNQNVRWIGSYLAFPGRIEREVLGRPGASFGDLICCDAFQTLACSSGDVVRRGVEKSCVLILGRSKIGFEASSRMLS